MSILEVNGTALEYAERGRGQPLVLVHGSASDHRTWHNQQDEFARRYRTVNYSRRYHWPNGPIPENVDYSMQEQLDDLAALIQKLGMAPAHLVGHSYGAVLCLLLAMRHPELVRSLVLGEPPVITLFVSNDPKPLELLKLLSTRPRTALTFIKFGANGMAPARALARKGEVVQAMRLFGSVLLGQEFFNRLSESRLQQVDANAIKMEFLGSGFLPLDSERVRRVQAPALLVTARYSNRLFHRLADRLEQLLPNTARVEIDAASHIMHEDNAPAYNHAVQSFLLKHSKAA